MTSWVQLKCPECSKTELIEKDKRWDEYECKHCGKKVCQLPKEQAFHIGDGRSQANRRMSAEYRDGVLAPIMSQRGASGNVKYG